MRNVRLHSFLASVLVLGISLTISSGALAQGTQGTDSEPNASCAAAQDLGAIGLPFTVQGSLDTPPGTPDVDFYRFSATPGRLISFALEGVDAGAGTLDDPYLGYFRIDGDCYFNQSNDDLVGRDAGLTITVPSSGVVVVAATSYGDWEFQGTGGSAGTYRLTISEVPVAQAVSGRVVDAVTGQRVPYAIVSLMACDEAGNCDDMAGSIGVDATSSFRFQTGTYTVFGRHLLAGSYQLAVQSIGYQDLVGEPFQLAAGQDLNVGDIRLEKVPAVGSISGRLIDEISGQALTGSAQPYAWVELQYCGVWGCNGREMQYVRPDGTFRFEGSTFDPMLPGTYQLMAGANQYQDTYSGTFEVANGQHLTFGDFRVKSMPARISLVEACAIPAEGGTCQLTMRVTNGATTRLEGEAWGMVQASWTGSPAQRTEFQVGTPKALSLAPGGSADLPLTFEVPGSVTDGSSICVIGYAAQRPHEFNTLGTYPVACFRKGVGGFIQVPENKKQEAVRRARGQAGPTQP
ncbi:MAG TPA: carboxypeptidase-like regulatory domain-containing protein [Thermoanaerobaculia bacterium]